MEKSYGLYVYTSLLHWMDYLIVGQRVKLNTTLKIIADIPVCHQCFQDSPSSNTLRFHDSIIIATAGQIFDSEGNSEVFRHCEIQIGVDYLQILTMEVIHSPYHMNLTCMVTETNATTPNESGLISPQFILSFLSSFGFNNGFTLWLWLT